MKCVKKQDGTVERLTEPEASVAVKHGASYCPKKLWKAQRKK
jgi:hypothetical protein